MSKDALINECRSVTLRHLEDSFGRDSVISLIVHGSLARNRESYIYIDGRPYIESDIDLIAVIKKIDIIKYMRSFKSIVEKITQELRTKFSLAEVSLVIITEKRLQHAKPISILQVRSSSKVIFGKDVITLLPDYRHNQIPVRELLRIVFSNMVGLLEHFVNSEIKQEIPSRNNYDSFLKSLQKMTSVLIRVIVIKEGIPANPYDLNEISTRTRHTEYSEKTELLEHILDAYGTLDRVRNSRNQYSKGDIKKYLIKIVSLFNRTLVILTGNQEVRNNPSEKMLFGGSVKLFRRLQLGLYISPRFFGMDTIGDLGRAFAFVILLGPDYSYLPLYRLFLKAPSLLNSDDGVNKEDHELATELWLKSFEKNFKIWNLSSCIFADSF